MIVDVIAYSARQKDEPNKYMQNEEERRQNFYKRLMPVLNKAASTKNLLEIVEQ